MKQKKICESCCHYERYYVFKDAEYKYAQLGYCSHHYMTTRERRTIPYITDCAFHEPREIQLETRREKIKTVIRDMRKTLSDISMMLKDEEM